MSFQYTTTTLTLKTKIMKPGLLLYMVLVITANTSVSEGEKVHVNDDSNIIL